ncbi:MAG: hypothetical protein Q8O88_01425 [bacterium]|nr:hypothetical protein [bacterium]
MTKIGIVGYGVVGKHLHERILSMGRGANHELFIYDPAYPNYTNQDDINKCDLVFVAVPTPQGQKGECDISIVEDVIGWLTVPIIVIRSTIEVGTTDILKSKFNKKIIFQPEFLGETADHPMNKDTSHIVLGGNREDTQVVADFYQTIYNAYTKIMQTDAKTAELLKYMRNSFLAMKVIFCNEFFDVANAVGVDYHELRELFILDPRITPSHTFVYPINRGYGGKCFPKDVKALISLAEVASTDVTLIRAVDKKNEALTI